MYLCGEALHIWPIDWSQVKAVAAAAAAGENGLKVIWIDQSYLLLLFSSGCWYVEAVNSFRRPWLACCRVDAAVEKVAEANQQQQLRSAKLLRDQQIKFDWPAPLFDVFIGFRTVCFLKRAAFHVHSSFSSSSLSKPIRLRGHPSPACPSPHRSIRPAAAAERSPLVVRQRPGSDYYYYCCCCWFYLPKRSLAVCCLFPAFPPATSADHQLLQQQQQQLRHCLSIVVSTLSLSLILRLGVSPPHHHHQLYTLKVTSPVSFRLLLLQTSALNVALSRSLSLTHFTITLPVTLALTLALFSPSQDPSAAGAMALGSSVLFLFITCVFALLSSSSVVVVVVMLKRLKRASKSETVLPSPSSSSPWSDGGQLREDGQARRTHCQSVLCWPVLCCCCTCHCLLYTCEHRLCLHRCFIICWTLSSLSSLSSRISSEKFWCSAQWVCAGVCAPVVLPPSWGPTVQSAPKDEWIHQHYHHRHHHHYHHHHHLLNHPKYCPSPPPKSAAPVFGGGAVIHFSSAFYFGAPLFSCCCCHR